MKGQYLMFGSNDDKDDVLDKILGRPGAAKKYRRGVRNVERTLAGKGITHKAHAPTVAAMLRVLKGGSQTAYKENASLEDDNPRDVNENDGPGDLEQEFSFGAVGDDLDDAIDNGDTAAFQRLGAIMDQALQAHGLKTDTQTGVYP